MSNVQSRSRLWLVALCVALLCAIWPARSAIDIFLKLEGVEGESRDAAHQDEIDVLAWSWGMSSSYSPLSRTNQVAFQGLHVTKYLDVASAPLMTSCASGKHIRSARLTCRRAGLDPFEFVKVGLSNVLVTSVSEGATSGEDRPTEHIAFSFSQVEFDYFHIEGGTNRNAYFKWDLVANTGTGGTDETLDTDRDGMPDTFENAHGLNNSINDAAADKDGDGMSNLDEYLAGTSPSDRNSVFKCRLVYVNGAPSATLSWNSIPGRQYRVAYTDNPGGGLNLLGNYNSSTGSVTQITIPIDLARRFYRVQVRQVQ